MIPFLKLKHQTSTRTKTNRSSLIRLGFGLGFLCLSLSDSITKSGLLYRVYIAYCKWLLELQARRVREFNRISTEIELKMPPSCFSWVATDVDVDAGRARDADSDADDNVDVEAMAMTMAMAVAMAGCRPPVTSRTRALHTLDIKNGV